MANSSPSLTNQFLSQDEQQQSIWNTLVEWNQTQVPYPDRTINQLFEAQVKRTPDAIALVFREQQISYSELNHRANQLAHYLQSFDVKPQTLIGICLERSIEMVVGLLAILKVGCVYVPLDPAYPQERLLYMLEDAQISVLITQHCYLEVFPPGTVHLVIPDLESLEIAQASAQNLSVVTTPDDLAYINYTSGSTGRPKGVAVPHRGVIRLLFGANYANLNSQQVFLQLAPAAFDATTFELWGALLHGSKCVLFPGQLPTIQLLREVLQTQTITTLFLTTALFNTIIDEAPEILSSVQQLLTGGESHSVVHICKGLKALPRTELISVYGPTETTTFATFYPIPLEFDEGTTSIPIGRPISNTQIYVLDSKLQPVAIGVTGELYIGGDGLARGYLNQPEQTQEKFISNPFSDKLNAHLYKTGDLVRYLPDGNLEFIGRIDQQVKIRGFRIELSEIESVLNAHPKVRQVTVLVKGCSAEDKHLVAYVVPDKLNVPNPRELQDYLKQGLPHYMVPTQFILLDRLPLTPNGKVDRRTLGEIEKP